MAHSQFKNIALVLTALISFLIFPSEVYAKKKSGDRLSVEIRNRMYPKKKKFEISGDFGAILNQSYISSQLIHVGATYFSSESLGFGADFSLALNSDKIERICVENFYNDPDSVVGPVCAFDGLPATADADLSADDAERANMGPAYPTIREMNYLISGHMVWNPVYGKQLFFMSGVIHFDLFVTLGGGVVMSDLYSEKLVSELDGSQYRGKFPDLDGGSTDTPPGVTVDSEDYGAASRPVPVSETTPMLTFGIGQKFHMGKNFNLRMEVRNYTLVGTENIFETYFAAWGGLGIRM